MTPRQEALACGEKHYIGKVCNEHPELKGLRYGNRGCIKCVSERDHKRRQSPEHREWHRKHCRSPKNRKRQRERHRARWRMDDQFRFVKSLRSDIHQALKAAGVKKNFRTHEVIGCSPTFYREWIESKWEPGWSWENRGKVWQVDHIRPIASFDMSKFKDVCECFNWLNCQPLSREDNIRKGAMWNGFLWRKGVPQYPVDKSTLANA